LVLPPAAKPIFPSRFGPLRRLFWIEAIMMNFAELKRWQDFKNPGSQGKQYFLGLEAVFSGSGNPAYPGGQWFNMFNLGKTPEAMKKLQVGGWSGARMPVPRL
jgi:light-harvesting complex I chlorophyll a/b binding protein 3